MEEESHGGRIMEEVSLRRNLMEEASLEGIMGEEARRRNHVGGLLEGLWEVSWRGSERYPGGSLGGIWGLGGQRRSGQQMKQKTLFVAAKELATPYSAAEW